MADSALVIDFTDMNGIRVDAPAKRAWVQPGVRTGDLLQALERHGLAVPVGRVSQVGVAGLTLGGGIGALMGTYGLTIDNVVSLEVVTADGRVLRAAGDDNPDLYWALRGGGGNFGVVTEFEFELHEQGTLLAGRVVHPATEAADVLRFYRQFAAAAPDELTVSAGLLHTPDGTPAVAVVPVYSGDDLVEGERLLLPLRAVRPPARGHHRCDDLLGGQLDDGRVGPSRAPLLLEVRLRSGARQRHHRRADRGLQSGALAEEPAADRLHARRRPPELSQPRRHSPTAAWAST